MYSRHFKDEMGALYESSELSKEANLQKMHECVMRGDSIEEAAKMHYPDASKKELVEIIKAYNAKYGQDKKAEAEWIEAVYDGKKYAFKNVKEAQAIMVQYGPKKIKLALKALDEAGFLKEAQWQKAVGKFFSKSWKATKNLPKSVRKAKADVSASMKGVDEARAYGKTLKQPKKSSKYRGMAAASRKSQEAATSSLKDVGRGLVIPGAGVAGLSMIGDD